MADVIHEFSSDTDISYSELSAGHTLATTSGSETAVIRDIAFEVPGGRSVDIQIDGITLARCAGSSAISGTLLMGSSQTLKAVPAESAIWVGIKFNYYSTNNDNSSRYYSRNALSSTADYFKVPEEGTNTQFNSRENSVEINSSQTNLTSFTNGGGLGTSHKITLWHADSMFNKPEGDIYYTEQFYNAKANNGYNHLKYYDKSANTVTELVNGDSDYRNWNNGYTNKYFMRYHAGTSQYFQTFDTSTHTLGSKTFFTRADNGGASYIYYYAEQGNFSPLDDFCIGRTSPYNSSDTYLTLIRLVGGNSITAGRMCRFTSSGSVSDKKPMRSYSTGSNSHCYCQLVKNSAGIYYVLWPYYRSNSWASDGANYGLQIFELGTASTVDGFFSGTYEDPSGLQHICTWNGTTSSPGSNEIDYRGFRISDSASSQYGWSTGFCPLKKLTATDSSSRYWLYMNGEFSYLIDLDKVSGDGHSFITQLYWKEGTTTQNTLVGGTNEYWTWQPDFSPAKIGGTYGTMKARVTGIKST